MRIAASTYLNSAPLVYSFVQGAMRHQYSFLGDAAPSRCAAMLAANQCEIALIPIIEYQRIPGLRIIPDIAVASKRRVRSVLLVARCPLQDVRRVTLDPSSRTSQALARILFANYYQVQPVFSQRQPNAAVELPEPGDAALIIGDPAMRLAASAKEQGKQPEVRIYDLAEEWQMMTGLPFVFAVWAMRESLCEKEGMIARDFLAAKQEGLGMLKEIAAQYAVELKLPQDDLLSYLQSNVNYDLDQENIAGINRYFELAEQLELIPAAQPLKFIRRSVISGAVAT